MKIAITGGAGFIGTHLTKAYLDAGHNVIILDNFSHYFRTDLDPRARFYQVDIRDEKLRSILQDERPDIVSHHVSMSFNTPSEQALRDADIHIRGLLNVLDGCINASVRKIIFASGSNSMYGPITEEQLPLNEQNILAPSTAFDISCVTGEWYVRYYTQQYGLKHTILRYSNVYGEELLTRFRHPLSHFIAMLQAGRRPIIRGSGHEIRDHIFIDDVVRANMSTLLLGDNRTLHISTNQGYTLNQIFSTTARLLGSRLEPLYLSGPLHGPQSLILDNTLARHQLNWQPLVSLEEGIRQTILQIQRTVSQTESLQTKEKQYKNLQTSDSINSSSTADTLTCV